MRLPTTIALFLLAGATAFGGNPKRPGDVVARDLNLLGFASLGHLGIYDGRRVLECLDGNTPIQKNSLGSFKSITSYWGARYLPKQHNFRKVVQAGWRQRHFKPRFTLSSVSRPGHYVNKRVWNAKSKKWEKRTTLVRAKFRCDTFVAYSYKKGIGKNLAKGGDIMPELVFLNCPKAR